MGRKSSKVRARAKASAARIERPTRTLDLAPQQPPSPLVVGLWYLAGAATLWAFGYTIMRGSDLWWHLAAGDWMAEHGGFLYTDPWSYTKLGQPWLNDAWLSDRIFHLWVRLFGLESLAWWKWGVLLAAYLLLMRTLQRLTGDLFSAYVGAVLAIAVGEAFLDIRTHLYSLLGTCVLLHLTLGRERPSPWLPLLFLIWVQLHAIFVFGLMALALILAPKLVWGSAEERRSAVWLGLACAGACLLNPNFVTVFTRPIRYALTSSPYRSIGEWQPPFEPGGIYSEPYPYVIGVFVVVSALLLLARGSGRDRRSPLVGIALGALTLAMSLKSRRFVPLFGITQALVLAPVLAWLLGRIPRRYALAPPLLALGLGVWLLRPYPQHSYAFHYLMAEDTFPIETMNFVQANRIEGKVFAYYNWGGYLHLRTQGALEVYIDGRADMVFDDEIYLRYVHVLGLKPGWQEIIEGSGAEYALWPKNDSSGVRILSGLLASGRWRLVYEDHVSKLLERADRPLRQDLRPTSESAWRDLALGSAAADRNRLDEAEAHYRKALERMPYLSAACFDLTRVLGAQGRLDEARKQAEVCERVYPYPVKRQWLAAWLSRLESRKR